MDPKRPGLFNANPKQILLGTSVDPDKLTIYMNMQKAILAKGFNEVGVLILPDFNNYQIVAINS